MIVCLFIQFEICKEKKGEKQLNFRKSNKKKDEVSGKKERREPK